MNHKYIILRHVKINRANGKSSSISGGIPALTAWMGSTHLLERKIRAKGLKVKLPKMAVVYHKCHLLTYQETRSKDNTTYIANNLNPMIYQNKKAQKMPFNEELKINLNVTIIIEADTTENDNKLLENIENTIYQLKIASGDIIDIEEIEIKNIDDTDKKEAKKLLYSTMPGYVLIERKDLILKEFGQNCEDGLDSMLKNLVINEIPIKNEEDEIIEWQYWKKETGWIIPIAVGYKALTELGKVKNQRDPETAHRFAETIVTLGEMKLPIRFKNLDDIMWEYAYNPTFGIYEIKNENSIMLKEKETK